MKLCNKKWSVFITFCSKYVVEIERAMCLLHQKLIVVRQNKLTTAKQNILITARQNKLMDGNSEGFVRFIGREL